MEYAVFNVPRTSIVRNQALLFQATVNVDVRALILDDETAQLGVRRVEAVHEEPETSDFALGCLREHEPPVL